MSYVNCARYTAEQNIIVVQENDCIYYEVFKDIPMGSELLVWYSDVYIQFMGIPVTMKESIDARNSALLEQDGKFVCYCLTFYQQPGHLKTRPPCGK